MAVPPAADDTSVSDSSETSTHAPDRTTSRLRLGLALFFVLAMLGCLGSLLVLVLRPADDESTVTERVSSIFDSKSEESREREVAMSQAEQFVLRVHTYGPQLLDDQNAMPEYRELVTEVMTPKFGADFEEQAGLAEATVAQAGVGRSAEIFSYGTSAIDSDSATVLVAGSFTTSYPSPQDAEKRIDTDAVPFRYEVTLRKIEGDWLVDAFVDLTGEPEEEAQ